MPRPRFLTSSQVTDWTGPPAVITVPSAPRGYVVTAILLDDFNRTTSGNNVGTPQIGTAPTYHTGDWSTNGTNLVESTTGEAVISWDVGRTTYTAYFTVAYTSGDNGFAVRVQDNMNYVLIYTPSASVCDIYTRIGGSYVQRAVLTPITLEVGGVLRAAVTPTSIAVAYAPAATPTVFTDKGTWNDSTYFTTQPRVGVRRNGATWGLGEIRVEP